MTKPMFIIGTRPEAIKLAPVIREFNSRGIKTINYVTGQQPGEMVLPIFKWFGIRPTNINERKFSSFDLSSVFADCLSWISEDIRKLKPGMVVVQGDTTSATTGAMAAFYNNIPVAHVEAGLRTYDLNAPYPEEAHRKIISQIATHHLAPTLNSKQILAKENITAKVTGNTVIDALVWTLAKTKNRPDKNILVTAHRRENIDGKLEIYFAALNKLAEAFPQENFVFPVHTNPLVSEIVRKTIRSKNIMLKPPLPYAEFCALIASSKFIITDSGGIQEEASFLGKPVLLLRDKTERPEAVANKNTILIGNKANRIITEGKKLLSDPVYYKLHSKPCKAYGLGNASAKIADILL